MLVGLEQWKKNRGGADMDTGGRDGHDDTERSEAVAGCGSIDEEHQSDDE